MRNVIPDDQVNSGGTVDEKSPHKFPVDGKMLPWHQGTAPEWMTKDQYAEYVEINGRMAKVSSGATRIAIDLLTSYDNVNRYNDWKGYDDIEPAIRTSIMFNGRPVYSVRAYPGDLLKHLVSVERTVEKLRNLRAFGWWQEADIKSVWGSTVGFKGLAAKILPESDSTLSHGAILLDVPGYESEYFDGGYIKEDILSRSIDWYFR